MKDIFAVTVSQVKSYSLVQIREIMKQRVACHRFERWERENVEELCLIMAEVYKLPDDYKLKINGDPLPASVVQEVFWEIDERHIAHVMENFRRVNYVISNKKAYLRTALYNSVFEIVHTGDNEANAREDNG